MKEGCGEWKEGEKMFSSGGVESVVRLRNAMKSPETNTLSSLGNGKHA